MFVVEKLKGNKFVEVAIPKNCDFFARLGGVKPVQPSGTYSGDSYINPNLSKTEQLAVAAADNEYMLHQEEENHDN